MPRCEAQETVNQVVGLSGSRLGLEDVPEGADGETPLHQCNNALAGYDTRKEDGK